MSRKLLSIQNLPQSKLQSKQKKEDEVNSTKTNSNPFICSNHQCKICFNVGDNSSTLYKKLRNRLGIHSECLVGEYDGLLASLQKKKKDSEPLKQSINKIFDDFIEYLSELRQKYIEGLDYYGLSQQQRQLFSYFQNGQYDKVTSQLAFSIVKQIDQQIEVDILTDKQRLQNYWRKQETKIKKSFQQIKNLILKRTTKIVNNLSIGSKIMISDKQEEDLIKMLQDQQKKYVKELDLLYRASQNDFDVMKFHQKCDLIQHTVVVIQTEHGKKIGGYTPLGWDGRIIGQYQSDSSGKSFIFSLTNNHKFTLLKSQEQKAIYQQPRHGPVFGGFDICIIGQGNVNNCYAGIRHSYTHPEYQNDQASWTKFSGAIGTHEFKVKEWEVFQVKWSQK